MKIGKCNPLSFRPSIMSDPNGLHPFYLQRFATDDVIVLQAICDDATSVSFTATDMVSGATTSFTATQAQLFDGSYANTAEVSGLPEGIYTVTLSSGGSSYTSNEFEVCDDNLDETILIDYTHTGADGIRFGHYFDGGNIVFHLRLQGGFKPGGYQPQVEVSTYRTQMQELRVLYSQPYAKYQLTVGTANGVPVETVELLNEILSLDTVTIAGLHYVRSDGEVPQKSQSMTASQLFHVTCTLERQESLDGDQPAPPTPPTPPTPVTRTADLEWVVLEDNNYVWEGLIYDTSTSMGNVTTPVQTISMPTDTTCLKRVSQPVDLTGFDASDLKVRARYQGAEPKTWRVAITYGGNTILSDAFATTWGTATYTLGDKTFRDGGGNVVSLADYIGEGMVFTLYLFIGQKDSPGFLFSAYPVDITLSHTD